MRKRIEWTPQARADVRRIDRQTALKLLGGLADYVLTVLNVSEAGETVSEALCAPAVW